MKFFDISEPVDERSATFPGDTPFSREWVARIEQGSSCNVSTMRMSVHVGTHTDSPLHFDCAGADMAAVDLRRYIGRCRVVDVRGVGSPKLVPAALLTDAMLHGAERLLLRTNERHDRRTFDPDFCAIGPDAARRIVEAGIVLVGIDTPSVDHAASKDLAGHHVLYRGGVALLENLDLTAVPVGDYELIALPLRLVGSDSSPVRAVLRELPPASS
ncbi:MAG: arylformamidase [Planctomycetota bacterium]